MSIAISEPRPTKFLARFEHVCAALRRYQVRKGLCWTLLAAALGLAALAAADFRWELPWNGRAAGLLAFGVATLAVLLGQVILPLRWWTKPRTAVEIESKFPQLGQRIRTVVQYAGLSDDLIQTEGVAPSLVDALERETEIKVQPLPLDRVVPWRRVWAVAALAVVPVLFLLVATARDGEWRIALQRALLSRRPYTTVSLAPGNLMVDQGESVPIKVELHGRLKRDVVLYTRPIGQPGAPWKAAALDAPDSGPASKREAKLEKVENPLDYRVTAGLSSSPTYRLDVRYPLALKEFNVTLEPPAYTGVKPSTVKGGDLRVIEGTEAKFQVAFDSTPAEASLILTDPSVHSKKEKTPPAPLIVPLKLSGATYTAGLKLNKGMHYQIQARTADGRVVPKTRYKIDVLEDRAPRLAFEQPDEALEVHPVAEVLNRIRVGDDFGLTKAGIVFQFNNGDEQTLILKDFKGEPAKSRTTAGLQETLLLEKLAATPTDSLTYYAFAEDNYPSGPHRTETDLRYVDIRPFKREYKLSESGDAGLEGDGEFTSLGELIARQRFNLNRANRLAKHKPADKTFAEDPLKIAGFEETLVERTRELTTGVEGIIGERIEPLHAAEESMLAAIAALDHGQNERAPANMGDALRHLIEARNTLRIAIGQEDAAARQAMRGYDRLQAQKIRKPKKDKDEALEIVEEIEQLAQDEDFVYASLSAIMMEQQADEGKKGEEAKGDEAKDAEKKMDPAEKKDEAKKKAEKSPKGSKGSKGSGPGQGKGQDGEKGEADEDETGGEPKKDKRREATERQEQIADKLRELEEKLKKLEAASDLAKARMANAAETAEKASGALARGNTSEATETAKAAAGKLHELARQVKGELAREVATELAMARDLADELAEREAELGQMPGETPAPGTEPGDKDGKNTPGKDGKGKGKEKGKGARGGWGDLTEAERLERMEEAAKTLEHWLKDASLAAEGPSAERIRELIEESNSTRVVESTQRIGELYLAGQKAEARRDAKELSRTLELLARQIDVLYRGIIAPELANLVEFDRRIAELMEKIKNMKPGDDIVEWRRLADALVRDLEKGGLTDSARALSDILAAGDNAHLGGRDAYLTALSSISVFLQGKIQDLILKDLVSARDEATPPAFKELVERYYEVLSKNGGSR